MIKKVRVYVSFLVKVFHERLLESTPATSRLGRWPHLVRLVLLLILMVWHETDQGF